MKKILVTGGAGYIGSHVTNKLLDQGYAVTVLDSFYYGTSGIQKWKDHPKVTIIEGDICNIKDVVRAVKGNDTIIALAAIVGDPACALNSDETLSSNYESTKVLAELAKYHKVKRIVFASSCSVYGASSNYLLNEGSLLNPLSLYAKTRVMSEEVLLQNSLNIEIVILRLATVFGISDRMRFDLVLNVLVLKALLENTIGIYGKDLYRPLVHVQDAANAFILAAAAPKERVAGQIFNVGETEMNFQIGELAEQIQRFFPEIKVVYRDVDDNRDYKVDFSKIKELLGFKTKFNLQQGIIELKSFLENNSDRNFNDDIFYNVNYLYKPKSAELIDQQIGGLKAANMSPASS